MKREITVAAYLFDKLKQLGIDHVFGVPGDYNLWLLEELFQNSELEWCSNSNELNAAYAADGYARIRGAAALITTFGVGELSALNGLAGSAAESVPVIHIVGAPPLANQLQGALMHHTFGDGDFGRFHRIHAEVAVAHALLTEQSAKAEIDRVIAEAMKFKKPGYLVLPMDVVNKLLPEEEVVELSESSKAPVPACDLNFMSALSAFLDGSPQKCVIAGHLVERFGVKEALREVVSRHELPYASLLMGKGVLDERGERNVGLYAGGASEPKVLELVEGSDVVIALGVKFTDAVTGGFTDKLDRSKVVDIQPFETVVNGKSYAIDMSGALSCLDQYFRDRPNRTSADTFVKNLRFEVAPESELNQIDLWKIVQDYLGEGDIVVADLGTTFFGVASVLLPKDGRLIAQPLWGSIGYSIPAAYGVLKAAPRSNVTLIVGDGSALLTAQEIGVMLRDRLSVTILLLNNEGYTIERLICNPERAYHDVPSWDWQRLPALMCKEGGYEVCLVRTNGELFRVLDEGRQKDGLRFIEVVLPKLDAPELMTKITNSITNKA